MSYAFEVLDSLGSRAASLIDAMFPRKASRDPVVYVALSGAPRSALMEAALLEDCRGIGSNTRTAVRNWSRAPPAAN